MNVVVATKWHDGTLGPTLRVLGPTVADESDLVAQIEPSPARMRGPGPGWRS